MSFLIPAAVLTLAAMSDEERARSMARVSPMGRTRGNASRAEASVTTVGLRTLSMSLRPTRA